jgi:hypothetical protein
MILEWFNAQVAVEAGTSLADIFAPPIGSRSVGRAKKGRSKDAGRSLQGILDRLEREIRVLRLNFYKRVKFANSFKWRLMENGVEKTVADQVTHLLLLRLYANPARIGSRRHPNAGKSDGRTRP